MSKHAPSKHPFFAAPQLTVTTSNAVVSYRKLGTGPALLFVHGWPVHGATYRDAAALLADRYTCYVIDLPGAGATPGYSDWSQPLRSHTDTVIEVIKGLGLEQVALVGFDSGGAIARWVAAELGDRITALILSNTEITDHVVKLVKRFAQFTKVPGSMFVLRRLLGSARFRRGKNGFAGCFNDRDLIAGEFHDLFIAPLLADKRRFKETIGLLANVDFEELADLAPIHAKIHAPTRFIWGARGPFFPAAQAREMSKEFSGFDRMIEIPDGKLFVHEEYPEQFAAAAAELLDAVVPRLRLSEAS